MKYLPSSNMCLFIFLYSSQNFEEVLSDLQIKPEVMGAGINLYPIDLCMSECGSLVDTVVCSLNIHPLFPCFCCPANYWLSQPSWWPGSDPWDLLGDIFWGGTNFWNSFCFFVRRDQMKLAPPFSLSFLPLFTWFWGLLQPSCKRKEKVKSWWLKFWTTFLQTPSFGYYVKAVFPHHSGFSFIWKTSDCIILSVLWKLLWNRELGW